MEDSRTDPPTTDEPAALPYALAGAVFAAADRVSRTTRAIERWTAQVTQPASRLGRRVIPSSVRSEADATLKRLDHAGREALDRRTHELRDLLGTAADTVADDPILVEVVERIVGHVQWQIVDELLPAILDRLTEEPAQVQALVRGQSQSVIDELAAQTRTRAAHGDQVVDRIVARTLGRRAHAAVEPGNGSR
jgi:hypothetical protein